MDYIDEEHGFLRKREAKAKFRERILKGWDYKCAYCGEDLRRMATLDHVHPKAKGGLTVLSNLVPACFACNISKSDTHPFYLWYDVQDFRSAHRHEAIVKWINDDDDD